MRAARLVADRIAAGGLVHIAGPGGHSQLAGLDAFYRPGGLAAISPLLDPDTSLASGALRSTEREREHGRGARLLDQAALQPQEVLIIVNAFGVNATVIDIATAARERGVTTIGLSSLACEQSVPLDHPARAGGGPLSRLCDVHIDTKVPAGDAVALDPSGEEDAEALGPTATSANAFTIHALLIEAFAALEREGRTVDRWMSSNLPGGDARNAELAARYGSRVAAL